MRALSHSVMSDSFPPCGVYPTRLLRPWDSSGKDTGVGCQFLLQGIFLTQGLNPGLPHCPTLPTLLPQCSHIASHSVCSVGDLGSIPGLGRCPGEGKGHPLQFSGPENFMDCIVHGVAESRRRLSDFHFHFHFLPHCRQILYHPSHQGSLTYYF